MKRIVVLSAPPALLPEHASLHDPVDDLRASCLRALAHLLERHDGPIRLVTDPVQASNAARGITEPAGARAVRHLLGELGSTLPAGPEHRDAEAWIVVANGSARRGEKAPGHLDERAFAFDDDIEKALWAGDGTVLAGLDTALGEELLAEGIAGLVELGRAVPTPGRALGWFSSDERGVAWWVVSWL
ncbi:hypothetical protein [Nocardioides sp. AE5]|uniref:hypothetical protein n=1 Tax=Nocardioides sp. AE5 TaxID=2962573 RepID=UPI0028812FD9|nr:hypothetical protein [Nocardioides sp. AE5]MDT0201574.1 hypothetical protein [Nocardioides sp. AE5]